MPDENIKRGRHIHAKAALAEFLRNSGVLDSEAAIKRDYCYFKVSYDPATMAIKSFELNKKKVEKARRLSGFFAIMTHSIEFSAMEAFRTYSLRDEQEKYFHRNAF